MFDGNTDMGIVVTIAVIAILVLVVVAIMLIAGRSREQMKALSDISAQIKEAADRPVPEPQVIQYVPVMQPQPEAKPESQPEEAPAEQEAAPASDEVPADVIEDIREAAGDQAGKITDPLEEILNFSFMKEEKAAPPKEDKSNLGRSGKRYTQEELEALIKN